MFGSYEDAFLSEISYFRSQVYELRQLVKDAYNEGLLDGFSKVGQSTLPAAHPEPKWESSKARQRLIELVGEE